MTEIKKLTKSIIKFRDARDWKQFHNPKDVALSMVLEASELMEHFQWKTIHEVQDYIKKNKKPISEELADVLYWVLLMSHDLGIDVKDALIKKLAKNKKKYPVRKVKGKNTKYNRLK